MDASKVTRIEVIDQHGRVFVLYGAAAVSLALQDDGQTLKVFCVSEREPPKDSR